MLYCPHCGSPVRPQERYCFNCGAKIVQANEPLGAGPRSSDPLLDEEAPADEEMQRIGSDYGRAGYRRTIGDEQESSQPPSYSMEDRNYSRDSQERYRKAGGQVQDLPPLPPQAGVSPMQPYPQAPFQQPQAQPQAPPRPRRNILSSIGKILEIILYLGFILAAFAAIYLLYQFAGSLPDWS